MITSVSLVNFKCHRDLKISLPRGMVKFSGDSGSGKSSTVSGISYGLFGKVWKSKSLCRYDEKVFSVILEIKAQNQRWKIERCNSPKSVSLFMNGKLYRQGDEAEEKIQEIIGVTFKQYHWGVSLKGGCSILEVSPQEKYDGICSLAGVQTELIERKFAEIREVKKRLETKASDLNMKIGKSQGILSSLMAEAKKLEKSLPEDANLDQMESLADLEDQRLELLEKMTDIEESLANFGDSARSSLEKEITTLESKMLTVEEQLVETEGYTEDYLAASSKANEVRKAREYLEHITSSVKEENKEKKAHILAYFEKNLPSGVEPEDYRDHVRRLRESWDIYLTENKAYESVIAGIEKSKLQLSRTLQKIPKALPDYPELAGMKSPKLALANLRKIKKMVSLSGKCPHCHRGIACVDREFLKSDQEEEYNPRLLKMISEFESEIEGLLSEAQLQPPDPPKKPRRSLEKAEEILSNVEVMQGQLRSLDAGRSPLITKAKSALDALENELRDLPMQVDPSSMSDEDLALYHNLATMNASLKEKRRNLAHQLKQAKKKLKIGESIESLAEELISLKEVQRGLENKITERKEAEKNAEIISNHRKIKDAIKRETSVLRNLEGSQKKAQETIIGLEQLKVKIKEAVLKSIETAIVSINASSDSYVKMLMGDHIYIEMGLSSVTEGKVAIHIHNSSSGKVTKYEDFSDGERQRARLAFFLGINDFLDPGLKLVIIDEALNHVEEALNIKLLDIIAERPGNKIVISHEALEGKFDHCVRFHKEK